MFTRVISRRGITSHFTRLSPARPHILVGALLSFFFFSGGGVDGAWGPKAWVPPQFRRTRGRGGVTYLLLEGCHRRLGCTLVREGGRERGNGYIRFSFCSVLHFFIISLSFFHNHFHLHFFFFSFLISYFSLTILPFTIFRFSFQFQFHFPFLVLIFFFFSFVSFQSAFFIFWGCSSCFFHHSFNIQFEVSSLHLFFSSF